MAFSIPKRNAAVKKWTGLAEELVTRALDEQVLGVVTRGDAQRRLPGRGDTRTLRDDTASGAQLSLDDLQPHCTSRDIVA